MLKSKCPHCKKGKITFWDFFNKLISFDVLWYGYKCPDCKYDFTNMITRIFSTVAIYIVFPVSTTLEEYLYGRVMLKHIPFAIVLMAVYVLVCSYVLYLFLVLLRR